MLVFIPNLAMKQEPTLRSQHDLVAALKKWVLPHYEDLTTFPVPILKSDCFSLLKCYYESDKIEGLGFDQILGAIEHFMIEELWIPPHIAMGSSVAPQVEFHRWGN